MTATQAPNCGCDFATSAPGHHHRLLEFEQQPLAVIGELIEMASTWGEVEHGLDEPIIEPSDWVRFVEIHEWREPERVLEMMLGLWSVTRPCAHDRARTVNLGSTRATGSITAIEDARRRRETGQTA